MYVEGNIKIHAEPVDIPLYCAFRCGTMYMWVSCATYCDAATYNSVNEVVLLSSDKISTRVEFIIIKLFGLWLLAGAYVTFQCIVSFNVMFGAVNEGNLNV